MASWHLAAVYEGSIAVPSVIRLWLHCIQPPTEKREAQIDIEAGRASHRHGRVPEFRPLRRLRSQDMRPRERPIGVAGIGRYRHRNLIRGSSRCRRKAKDKRDGTKTPEEIRCSVAHGHSLMG